MKAKILLIEDDPASQKFVQYLLGTAGHTVLAASDGEEGLKAARQSHPDLILSDAQIPKIDGCELARLLKADESMRKIPLIAVTASVMPADKQRIMSAGFDGYIAKPYVPETFISQIESYLSPSKPAQAQPPKAQPTASKPQNSAKAKFIREMAEAFIAGLPAQFSELRATFDKGDFKTLRVMTHKMLGSCIFLDEPKLVEALRQLEKIIDSKQTDGIQPMLEEVIRHAQAAQACVKPQCV